MRKVFSLEVSFLVACVILSSLLMSATAAPANWWLFGRNPDELPYDEGFHDVAVDSSGYVYQVGYAYMGPSSNQPPYNTGADALIVKFYPSSGTILWQQTWGGKRDDYAYGVAVSPVSNNVYVVGSTHSFGNGVFILKFGSNGNLIWSKVWGGAGDIAYDVAVDTVSKGKSREEYIVAVGVSDAFGLGSYDAFVLKLHASTGNVVWQELWGTPVGAEVALAVAIGEAAKTGSKIYVTGYSDTWGYLQMDPFRPVLYDPNYGLKFMGDAFIIKLDASGTLDWDRWWRNPNLGFLMEVAHGIVFHQGSVIVVGTMESSNSSRGLDVFILCIRSGGNLLWSISWDKELDDQARGVTVQYGDPRLGAYFPTLYTVGESGWNATVIRHRLMTSLTNPPTYLGADWWAAVPWGVEIAFDVAAKSPWGQSYVAGTTWALAATWPVSQSYVYDPIAAVVDIPDYPLVPVNETLVAPSFTTINMGGLTGPPGLVVDPSTFLPPTPSDGFLIRP